MNSTRKALSYTLLIIVCVVVIVLSSLASDRIVRPIGQQPPPPGIFGRFGERWGFFGVHHPGWLGVASAFGAYIFLVLSGFLVLFLFPDRFGVISQGFAANHREWLRYLAVGFLSGLSILLLTGLGLATSVTFPIPLFLATLTIIAVCIGLISVAAQIGEQFNRWAGTVPSSAIMDFVVGLIIVFTLCRIPYLGWAFTILFGAIALGAVITTRFGTGMDWSLAGVKTIQRIEEQTK